MANASYRNKVLRKAQADRIKELLNKTDGLTDRQVDMVATAIMSMSDSAISSTVTQLEENPLSIMNEIVIPG